MWLTERLTQELPQELAPVVVLEENTAIHCHHQAARHLHPILQAQHCDQQAGSKAGAAACHKPADGLDLQQDSSSKSLSTGFGVSRLPPAGAGYRECSAWQPYRLRVHVLRCCMQETRKHLGRSWPSCTAPPHHEACLNGQVNRVHAKALLHHFGHTPAQGSDVTLNLTQVCMSQQHSIHRHSAAQQATWWAA